MTTHPGTEPPPVETASPWPAIVLGISIGTVLTTLIHSIQPLFPYVPSRFPRSYQSTPSGERWTNSIGMTFRRVKTTRTAEGQPQPEASPRSVEIYLGAFEVTQAEWKVIAGFNPSETKSLFSGRYPVENVSWHAAKLWIQRLNQREGRAGDGWSYRLPTREEWECANQGDGGSTFSWGNYPSGGESYGWFMENSGTRPHKAGSLNPNTRGFYDMDGNVLEWVATGDSEARLAPDPDSPIEISRRVLKGGSYIQSPQPVSKIYTADPLNHEPFIGFRVALVPPLGPPISEVAQ